MQCVIPNGTRRARVALAMRPKPRKPTVLVVGVCGEKLRSSSLRLSWGPQNANGDQLKLGHWRDSVRADNH